MRRAVCGAMIAEGWRWAVLGRWGDLCIGICLWHLDHIDRPALVHPDPVMGLWYCYIRILVALVIAGNGMPLVPLTPLQPSADADHVEVNVQYVHPAAPQPLVNADADLTVPLSATLRQVLSEAEHTGCSSGRAMGVLLVCSQVTPPEDCLTTRPAAMGPPATVAMVEDDPIGDFVVEDDQFSSGPADESILPAGGGAEEGASPSADFGAEGPIVTSGSGAEVDSSSPAVVAGHEVGPGTSDDAPTAGPELLPPISVLDIVPRLMPITSPASPSSACGSLSTATSAGLANPAANMLVASEQEQLMALARQIHARLLQSRSSGSSGESAPHYIAANWITTLRYMTAAMQAFPVPPGSEGAFMPAPIAEDDSVAPIAEDDTEVTQLDEASADGDL
eukprot:s917_g34.t1